MVCKNLNDVASFFTGAVTILPTILHLITGVIREIASRSADKKVPAVTAACLQALKNLCNSPFVDDEAVGREWLNTLQSSLATIIYNSRPGMWKSLN